MEWVVLGVSLAAGILVGILAVLLEKVGMFCAGLVSGYGISLLLFSLALSRTEFPFDDRYVIAGLTILFGAAIGFFFAAYKEYMDREPRNVVSYILIAATSILGGYFATIPVISKFVGLPSITDIANQLSLKQIGKVERQSLSSFV
jgi:hypothetical protein